VTRPPVLRAVDAVTIPVPTIDEGLRFYCDVLGHRLKWRNDEASQAAVELPDGGTELVLTTQLRYEPDWLVESVDAAVATFVESGGSVMVEPFDIPVGRLAVVADPFGNALVVLDLSKGTYVTDGEGNVTGLRPARSTPSPPDGPAF
jgi:predicted enzyme related to lactoylglutathione lyase